ncbi:MAG: alpha/beta hydrolase, partial [Pseudomonadota bacterium]
MRDELDVIPEQVTALHASACTKRQWRSLCEVLGREYDVVLPELGGYESISLPIRSGGPGLARRAAPVIEAIEGQGQPAHLVGHSFGGAVAIKIALMRPDLVRSLTVYEPAVFGLVRDSSNEADRRCFRRFQAVGSRLTAAVATGAPDVGMQHFIDFWNGAGAWAELAPDQKAGFSGRAASVMRDFIDGAYEQAALADLRRLTMRTLILSGTR